MIRHLVNAAFFGFLFLAFPALHAQEHAQQRVVEGRTNSADQQKKPYVILISADGFRHDYATKYGAHHLQSLSAGGVRAKSMIPSFPSVTFANHYTLVTGMYPSHHGIVDNSFFDVSRGETYKMNAKDKVEDGTWYGGTPLWVLAEQQQMIAASMFWVGSEAAIQGARPTYYYNFTEKVSSDEKVKVVLDWLNLPEEKRPHLITFYLSEPDHAGHSYGPDAEQTKNAVKEVDETIYKLTEAVKTTGLPVNFIFLSDHGMTAVDREQPILKPAAIDTAEFRIPVMGTIMTLHAKDKSVVKPVYKQLKSDAKDYSVYLKTKMPRKYHYGKKDDRFNRIGDILLIPEWPKVFSNKRPGVGYHGFFAKEVKDMHATFFAWGPAFKSNLEIGSFENVNVYPLVTEILGLEYDHQIDGKLKVLKKVLRDH